MLSYIIRRLLLIIPTMFGIMLLNFAIIQLAPGGPVEVMIAKIKSGNIDAATKFSGAGGEDAGSNTQAFEQSANSSEQYAGAHGIDPEIIAEIEKMYGFDKPAHERFFKMLKSYITFDFGQSFYRDASVLTLIKEKLPVSITLGVWSTLIVYFISIPLGIKKAVVDGNRFDVWSSFIITIAYSIPGFLFAIMLIIIFAGGDYLNWFPLRGLTSSNWDELSPTAKIADYLWHITLPVAALVIGAFAGLTMLTKNSFLDEIRKNYVVTARAKGLPEHKILYGHVFRNAMLIIISGLPSAFIGMLFTGSLMIEIIFSLDGIGLLGFESAINRDYPVMFATLYIFTLLGLLARLAGDLLYTFVDPRIDFEGRLA